MDWISGIQRAIDYTEEHLTENINMEEAAKATKGVKDAVVNFLILKGQVEFEDAADIPKVMEDVRSNCKKVEDDCEIYL